MPTFNQNDPVAANRRVAMYLYQDDGVTPLPLATVLAQADFTVRQGGVTYAASAGTFTNTGVDGEWIYEATQAELNFAGSEFGVKFARALCKTTIETVPMNINAATGTVNANVVSVANNAITGASIAADAVTKIANGVWNTTIESVYSAAQLFRLLIALIFGLESGRSLNAPKWTSPFDGAKQRAHGTTDADGRASFTVDDVS